MLVTDSGTRWLQIPQTVLDKVQIDLSAIPLELDYRTEMTLRKACVLVEDWKIDNPELIQAAYAIETFSGNSCYSA